MCKNLYRTQACCSECVVLKCFGGESSEGALLQHACVRESILLFTLSARGYPRPRLLVPYLFCEALVDSF